MSVHNQFSHVSMVAFQFMCDTNLSSHSLNQDSTFRRTDWITLCIIKKEKKEGKIMFIILSNRAYQMCTGHLCGSEMLINSVFFWGLNMKAILQSLFIACLIYKIIVLVCQAEIAVLTRWQVARFSVFLAYLLKLSCATSRFYQLFL